MLNVSRSRQGSVLEVGFKGVVNETVDFGYSLGPLDGITEIRMNCGEIQRINSTGVKAWILYFNALRQRGVRLRFRNCSRAIVEQTTFIRDFLGPGEIESVALPYYCENCQQSTETFMEISELQKLSFHPPELPCPKCKTPMGFDDMIEEYFDYWLD